MNPFNCTPKGLSRRPPSVLKAIRLRQTSGRALGRTLPRNTVKCTLLHPLEVFSDASSLVSIIVRTTVATVAAYVLAAWPARPRGWANSELVVVKVSTIQGRGLFARVNIKDGTTVGSYPGRPRDGPTMAAKCVTAPGAAKWAFKNKNGRYLDPTDTAGEPSTSPSPGLPWPFPVNIDLCYANEPPPNAGGCSIRVEDDPDDQDGIIFITTRGVEAGEELFVDYGVSYDRSKYDMAARPKSLDKEEQDNRV